MQERASAQERLPLLAPADLTGEQRAVYDRFASARRWAAKNGFRAETTHGELLGPFNAFLRTPAITRDFVTYQLSETRNTSLSPKLREVVILTVGAAWEAAYEVYAHRAVALAAGISEGDVERLCSGLPPRDLGAEGDVAQRVVLALAREHRLSDALYAEAAERFEPKALVDMLFLAGSYLTVSLMLNAFEVTVPAD